MASSVAAFNRTSLELKRRTPVEDALLQMLLIEPVWNRKK